MNKNIINSLNMLSQKNKTLIFSILLFCFVFIFLGVQYKKWWFIGGEDDYIDTYELGYKTKNWKWYKLSYFFYDGHTQPSLNNTNYKRTTFFTTSYRPLCCIGMALRHRLFGTNIYYYHLANVFLHAINAVILFNIFLWLMTFLPALLLAIIWAFHPLISWFFGNIVNFHYYLNVMLMLLIIIFFKNFLDSKNWKYNFLSCITFATSLFTRETSIVFPAIIFFGTYLYLNRFNKPSPRLPTVAKGYGGHSRPTSKIGIKHFYKNFLKTLKTTAGMSITAISFLLLRLYLYPINFLKLQTSSNHIKTKISTFIYFKNFIHTQFNHFKLFIYDLFGLSWIPWNPCFKPIRIGLFLLIIFLLFWLFIKNKKKIHILYFVFCMLLMLWPSYIKGIFAHGYFYEAYHFIFIALIFLFKFYNGNILRFKKIGLTILSIITILFTTLTLESFSRREKRIETRTKAIKELAYNPIIKNRSLYFFGLPNGAFVTNTKKAFWMLLDDTSTPMFFDLSFTTMPTNIYINNIPHWKTILSKYYFEKFVPENCVLITPVEGGFRLKSTDKEKVFFKFNNEYKSIGTKIINKTTNIDRENLATDVTILFDTKNFRTNTLFITWDYEKSKFKLLSIKE